MTTSNSTTTPYESWWAFCDLDGTLTPMPSKAGGDHLPLTRSATMNPLLLWLQSASGLAVISTAGTSIFRQILHPVIESTSLSSMMSASLVLSGWSGAAMFRLERGDWQNSQVQKLGKMYRLKEVEEYRKTGGPNNSTTCISRAVAEQVGAIGVSVYRELFRLFDEDPTRIKLLSKRYRSVFHKILEKKRNLDAKDVDEKKNKNKNTNTTDHSQQQQQKQDAEESNTHHHHQHHHHHHHNTQQHASSTFEEEILNCKNLTGRGFFLNDAPIICFQAVPRSEQHGSSSYSLEAHPDDEDNIIAQISFLGIPASLFPRLFEVPGFVQQLREEHNIHTASQPNSVAFVIHGVDKGSVIKWMLKHPADFKGLNAARSFCVGDMPASVDASMMRFSSAMQMPFFSVGVGLKRADVASARIELRRAFQRGGFIEYGAIRQKYEEFGTASLFQEVMHFLDEEIKSQSKTNDSSNNAPNSINGSLSHQSSSVTISDFLNYFFSTITIVDKRKKSTTRQKHHLKHYQKRRKNILMAKL